MMNKFILKVNGDPNNGNNNYQDDNCYPPAYLYFPNHHQAQSGCVKKSISVDEFIKYKGMSVVLDFDENDELIGIEVY